jgi:hypothetical protein
MPVAARFQYITLRNGIHFETSWLAWCDETLDTLATLSNETVQPGDETHAPERKSLACGSKLPEE